MAKAKARPRPRVSARAIRPRPAGRRRTGPSPAGFLFRLLFRLETLGVVLIILALISVAWLAPRTENISGLGDILVRTFGLHVFVLVALLAYLGWLILRRQVKDVLRRWKLWLVGLLSATFTIGILGFFRPDGELGETSLSEVTAGGDLGHLLASHPLGILIWLLAGGAAFTILWPHATMAGLREVPAVARTVWGWRLPQRAWRATSKVVDLVFPTRPPPDTSVKVPLETLMWARSSGAVLAGEAGTGVEEPPAELAEEAPPPADVGLQAELPLAMKAGEEAPQRLTIAAPPRAADGWQLPPLDVLADAAAGTGAQADKAARAQLIVDTLASFGVDARVIQINEGPTVTQFGIEPGWEVKTRTVQERDKDGRPILDKDGNPKTRTEEIARMRVRVNQITTLASDLALALAAPSIRIESPVPGKPFVGIEVPNTTASLVTLRSVIESPPFQRTSARSRLALGLGKGVSGDPVAADLARMPHLLIAGATGSGKSVCINSIIACLLMHASPEQVRLVMIDPKRVELSAFARIPHLAFSSIVVDLDKVVPTLQAVIHEMEARYRRFASLAVRNIDAYNRHPRCPRRLAYWVVIIDELADLMMAAPYEVERQVCRLAQLARATGIHLIIATQRPSVDVVTGLIKANFPTRIAFAMSSQVDSRTVLDMAGAEKLLGRGDMLYMPSDAVKPKRLQGVFVSDQEIERLVAFWTQDRFGELEREVHDSLLEEARPEVDELFGADDPLLERARELAAEHTRISTSLLQRRLRVGYPRAARLMDMLEERGIVGQAEGSASREVLVRAEGPDEED